MLDHLAPVLFAGMILMASNAAGAAFPDPRTDEAKTAQKTVKKAVLAGGCFWCTEVVFEHIDGVVDVVSGYSGGTKETADYETVSTGRTAHAEAIEITYGQLLKVFFEIAHDPTTLNRQGPDVGPHYRSAIFALNAEQKQIAKDYIAQLDTAKAFRNKIVTELTDFKAFYVAEGYHQNYCRRNPSNPYIMYNAQPKVEKLKKSKPEMLKK